MFFKKSTKKLPLLLKENIRTNRKRMQKNDVIRAVGQILVDSGYVKPDYVDAMIEREKTFATNIGNGIALPHGVEEAKKEIKASGIAVMIFPEGTDWDGEDVKLVIGIAGTGDDHLAILSNIAIKMSTPEAVDQLVRSSVDEIYDTLKGVE